MKKDIEWLNNEVEKRIEKIKTDEVSFVGSDFFDEGYIHGMKDVQAIANQLDEPEALSQEWISEKSIDTHVDTINGEIQVTFILDDLQNLLVPKESLGNSQKVEKEQEQKYYVDLDTAAYVAKWDGDDSVQIYTDTVSGSDEYELYLTEQEIKDYDERFWPFAKPMEEVD